MTNLSKKLLLSVLVALVAGFACQNATSPTPTPDGAASATPTPTPTASPVPEAVAEIFAKPPDEAQVMEVTFTEEDGTERTRSVPVNQIVLMFAEDVARTEAEATLTQMQADLAASELALVGQVPDLGIYQLEITNAETDPQAAIAVLDGVVEALRAYDGVEAVGYNELLSDRAVENDDDNCANTSNDRCAFAVIDYYQAIPIFDEVLPHVTLHDVTVAVIDSGLWVDTDQFDEILPRTQFPDQPATNPTFFDWHTRKHGTVVASLIAADNGDGIVNGIALRVLGDKLHLIVGNAHIILDHYNMAWAVASARRAVLLGADIVNISIGTHDNGNLPPWLQTLQVQFRRLFKESPDVLFVAAASNDGFVLNGNDVPAGLPNSNLLTVGGFENCDFDTAYRLSSTGPGVELAGPATDLPVCCVGDNMTGPIPIAVEGNSFVAPIVSSIAAIVMSINPNLKGAALKEFLLGDDQVWPAPADVGGRRPALIKTVGSALLSASSASAVDSVMDAYGPADDIPDPSGYAINRLCGHVEFTVTGPSHTQAAVLYANQITWGWDASNYGLIGMGHQVVLAMSQGSDVVEISTTAGFHLNQDYSISKGGANGLQIAVDTSEGRLITGIDGSSGTFRFDECELTTRSLPLDWYSPDNPGPDQLVFIEVSGSVSGTNQGAVDADGEVIHGVAYSASGEFTTAFMLIEPEADTLEYLEQACVGGRRYGEASP